MFVSDRLTPSLSLSACRQDKYKLITNFFVWLFHFPAQKSESSLTIIAAVAGVLGVVVLALIVALVVVYKRYHIPQQAVRAVYTATTTDENKMLV